LKTALSTSFFLEHLNNYLLTNIFFFFFSIQNNNLPTLSTGKIQNSRAISQVKNLEQHGTLGTNLEQVTHHATPTAFSNYLH
jgi:hypothetical protein